MDNQATNQSDDNLVNFIPDELPNNQIADNQDYDGTQPLLTVGIRFKSSNKVYSFDPSDLDLKNGELVVVQTVKGIEYATVASIPCISNIACKLLPLKPVLRIATVEDHQNYNQNIELARQAKSKANQMAQQANVKMDIVDAEYTLDRAKLVLYFVAENRVDFRDLVKEFARQFKSFIDLRQISDVEQVKMLDGTGTCGRQCCCTIGAERHSTIKMLKNQNLPLNPQHTLGVCGKLKCCISFENDYYAAINAKCSKVGGQCVDTQGNVGTVSSINYLKETAKVKFVEQDAIEFRDIPIYQLTKLTTPTDKQ